MAQIALLLMLLMAGSPAAAQKSKVQLEKEKKENLKKIAEAEKILKDTESKRKSTIGQLRAITEQISAREGLVKGLNDEIRLLDGEIDELSIIVNALQSDLKNLKDEYATMIYKSYKANQGFDKLTFLFSSSTFNELFMRLKYLEQYSEARKTQVKQIEEVSQELENQRSEVKNKRGKQSSLLNQQLAENKKLISLKSRQSSVIQELARKEQDLKKELANRKKAVEQLDNLIAEIVRKELERSKTLSSTALADEDELTSAFESRKTKLIWPVNSGFISSHFGKHPHPVLKGIIHDNTGVDIQTQQGEEVKCVHAGKVIRIAYVPGMYNVVIVQHGAYYTVYSRLKEVTVKKESVLAQSQTLGLVHTDGDGVSEVHFEVWKNFQKLDPEKWLARK